MQERSSSKSGFLFLLGGFFRTAPKGVALTGEAYSVGVLCNLLQ
jgi:hypothetical protein